LEVFAETPGKVFYGRSNGRLTFIGLRAHALKRDTSFFIKAIGVCHFVWWRIISGGVEFAIGVGVAVLEVLEYTRALTPVKATIPHWAQFCSRSAVLLMI